MYKAHITTSIFTSDFHSGFCSEPTCLFSVSFFFELIFLGSIIKKSVSWDFKATVSRRKRDRQLCRSRAYFRGIAYELEEQA